MTNKLHTFLRLPHWIAALLLISLIWTSAMASDLSPGAPGEDPGRSTSLNNTVYLPLIARQSFNAVHVGEDIPIPTLPVFEPDTAAVNPLNPQNIAVAAGTRLRISTDFGLTFPIQVNPVVPAGLPAGYGFCGDDSLAFDSQGRLFWSYLICADFDSDGTRDDLSAVVAQVNPNNGTIVGSADVTPGNNSDDKNWIAADANPSSPYRDNLYVVWTRFGTPRQVMFSRSTDSGVTWSAPTAVSVATEGFVWPSHVAAAPNGDVYVSYHTDTCNSPTADMVVLRDGSGGTNLAAGVIEQKSSFKAAVTCNVQSGAGTVPNTMFWMQGANAPYVIPDPLRPGRIFVIANDDPNNDFSTGDGGDVILATSTDYGQSWSLKTISHAPYGSLQTYPTGAIDQDGNLMAFWYDTRSGQTNAGGNFLLDVYATVSRDGGETFTNDFRINDNSFDPDLGAPCRFGPAPNCGDPDTVTTTRIGEYNGAAAANGIGYAAWTGNSNIGQQIIFDVFSILGNYPDGKEPNNAVNSGIVTNLGSQETYNLPSLTIHTVMDEDFYKVVALNTGKLTIRMDLSGRVSDLDLQAQDKYNPHTPPNVIANSTIGIDSNDQETIQLPVVAGETYYLRVYAEPGQAHPFNVYSLDIVNRPVPSPFGIHLAIGSDSGRSDQDDVTYVAQATIQLRVDEVALAGLPFSPQNGTPTLADDSPGYKVAVYHSGLLAGYAQPDAAHPGNYLFTFPASNPLEEGLNALTARVIIIDPSDDPDTPGTLHVVSQGPESNTTYITLDTIPPDAPSVPDLLPSSDGGTSDGDNVTNVNPPAFQGTAEANALIRIFANGTMVGEGVTGSDATDGVIGNGLGAWEVTVEPMADGTYDINAEAEDLAGNLSARTDNMDPQLVLDTADGGGMPQRPTLDLLDAYDTGHSDKDNITKLTELQFRISAEAGTTVVVKDGNTVIDTFTMPGDGFTIRTLTLTEGPYPMSTESTDLAGNTSHQSEELHVTVDTTPPATPDAPDLQAFSDSGGVNIDNITTIQTPNFEGAGEANAVVRLYADGTKVGQDQLSPAGQYVAASSLLNDDVYDMTVVLEDVAGNLSTESAALKVTIAHYSLNLPGDTTGPADMDVQVDLNVSQITGYPGVPGGVIGVVGIPTVNMDTNGYALTFLGAAGDDDLEVTPNGSQSGSVHNTLNGQVFNFSNVAGDLYFDTLSGVDNLTVFGTFAGDTITGTITSQSSITVNVLKTVLLETNNLEKISIASGQSVDTVNLTVYDDVNANVFVDMGEPTNVSHEQDRLNVYSDGKYKNLPGGPEPGSGSLEVSFKNGALTRIDYVNTEKLSWY